MNKQYSVDIVIPHYQQTHLIERTLKGLSAIEIPDCLENIWVVENGGKHGAEAVVNLFKNKLSVKYEYNEQGNSSLARNRGIELSKADIIIFFDNDMKYTSTCLTSYIEAFEKHGLQYFYGGSLEADYEVEPKKWLTKYLPASAKGFSLGEQSKEVSDSVFLGGNFAVPRKLLHLVKLFDDIGTTGDNSGYMGEETRLQDNLISKGHKAIYVPEAKVLHWVPSDRCSVDWVLKRAFRRGLTKAHQEIKSSTFPHTIPRYHIKEYMSLSIKRFFNLILMRNEERKFEINYKIQVKNGIFKGYKNK